MATVACVFIAACAVLALQWRDHIHQRVMLAEGRLLYKVEARVSALERKKPAEFDAKAFEDLKGKVEALRLAQGLKRG